MENISDSSVVKPPQDTAHHLSHKETRQIVTPYAFHVSPRLFGTALAKPKKRAAAIGIDMLLIALVSQSASFILAGVAAVTFFKAGNRLKLKKRFNAARLGLRFIAASLLFMFAWGLFGALESADELVNINGDASSATNSIAVAAISGKYMFAAATLVDEVNEGKCQPSYVCWQTLGDKFVTGLAETSLSPQDSTGLINAFLDISDEQLSEQEKTQLSTAWAARLSQLKPNVEIATKPFNGIGGKFLNDQNVADKQPTAQAEEPKVGILAWAQSLLEDLGLGFGWAALYFSIFTAWWKGQTPGKKLLGIKVIKLDGSEPNLWESFGRYGGYGAGLATGLMGFLQVYWDPNRQAIQDKISETLVIDLRIAKVQFSPEQAELTEAAKQQTAES
jgi:uncharacterized RDD family membrane protein YckC